MSIWDQLARTLRPMAEASLPDLALLERKTRTRVAGGGISEAYVTVASAVPCRVMPAALPQSETLEAGQPNAVNRWVVSFLMSTDVALDMRLTVTGTDLDGTAWTRVLEVVAVDGPKTYEVLRNATCIDPSLSGR